MDILPEGVYFSKEKNPDWYQNQDGNLITKKLANQIIEPSETKNITLVVNQKMNKENTGNITNIAKISKDSSNDLSKNNSKESKAELMISIKTGKVLLYLSFTIIITGMIAVGIYLIKKKVLQKEVEK
ncbi:MAG: hypothetical protein HFJ33_02450 [Clostridia bacterium]|nr:hypothetical protein [Clostridia bacterium]